MSGRDLFSFEEHESGPEILIALALTTAGISLLKSVVDLVVVIVKARSDGVKKGDRPSDPLDLIVRRMTQNHDVREEMILRVGHREVVSQEKIDDAVRKAVQLLVAVPDELKTAVSPMSGSVTESSNITSKKRAKAIGDGKEPSRASAGEPKVRKDRLRKQSKTRRSK